MPIPDLRRLLPPLLLALALPAGANELVLQAPGEIDRLLRPWLPEEAGSALKLQTQLGEILATEGYFSPQFEFSESEGELRLQLDPGPRTTIGEVALTVDGPAS